MDKRDFDEIIARARQTMVSKEEQERPMYSAIIRKMIYETEANANREANEWATSKLHLENNALTGKDREKIKQEADRILSRAKVLIEQAEAGVKATPIDYDLLCELRAYRGAEEEIRGCKTVPDATATASKLFDHISAKLADRFGITEPKSHRLITRIGQAYCAHIDQLNGKSVTKVSVPTALGGESWN